jgi:alpha-L-fucosidase
MHKPTRFVLAVLLAAVLVGSIGCSGYAAAPVARPPVTLVPEDKVRLSNDPAKTEIFRDAGFGLFIHWNPCTQLGAEISWPLFKASDDFIRKYYALADTFDPKAFDASEWARLAKLAGMEYVVFTAKHVDGFCMFDTDVSDFKVTRTPYGKDIVAQVADAFRKEGLLVGLYYSPGDFRHQWETGKIQGGFCWTDYGDKTPFGPKKLGFADYERAQIEELLTRYGDIFMLWLDSNCDISPLKKHVWRVRQDVFISRPEIPTPEEAPGEIPQGSDKAWESCMTTTGQWAYLPDASVLPSAGIIENLVHIRACGGNLLLNVGPRPDGRISPADENILRDLGLWMMTYGEAVHAVRPWSVANEGDVWFTRKKAEGTVYALAHLGESNTRTLVLKSVKATPETQVTLLGQAGALPFEQTPDGLKITVTRTQFLRLAKAWELSTPVAVKITKVQAPTAAGGKCPVIGNLICLTGLSIASRSW